MSIPEKKPPRVFLLKEVDKSDRIHRIHVNKKISDYRKKLGMTFFGAQEASECDSMPCIALQYGCSQWLCLMPDAYPEGIKIWLGDEVIDCAGILRRRSAQKEEEEIEDEGKREE